MSTSETPETFTPPPPDEEPEPPPETSQMVFGSGQALWLALVTVVSVVALAVAIVAVAIANGEDGASGGGAATPTPSDDLTINGGEFFFDPDSVLVPADSDVRVELVNEGNLDHNWTVLDAGVTIAAEDEFDESTVLAQVGDVAGGASGEGNFSFPAGQYQVICTIAGHFSGGMRGTLEAA